MTILRGGGRPTKYLLADGSPVPGVTTIIGRFKESGALLQWAFQQGKSGAANLYEKRDEAAAVGSLVHDIVEAEICGREPPLIPADFAERANSALDAWHRWREGSGMEIVATEVPLVSEVYRFGGTIDAIGRERGMLCLLDWKTSGGVYADYLLQLAAYKALWDEANPDNPIAGGFHLCRFSKEHGDFEHRYWPELGEAWEMFKALLPAYELDKRVRARCK